jgi:anti-sigma regulatory factor (Ser/Thr protein kinase)
MTEISLHIMDLVQNSIRAKASIINIEVSENTTKNKLFIEITDNGKGMSPEILKKASDPFFTSRTTRKVGLGISLYKQMVEQCNGSITLTSQEGKGTKMTSQMDLNNIDRQPMGDIAGVLVLLMAANISTQFRYSHTTEKGKYVIDTIEINNSLGNNHVNDPGVMKFIKEMIQENLQAINIQS